MYKISKTVSTRLSQGIKKFQPIFQAAKSRDENESNTVTIISDFLNEVFGYAKYTEITKEYETKGTYCDLATKINGKVNLLIEVKAVGINLKQDHMRQAVHYAADSGLDWVILTNGIVWKVYKMKFTKPIETELVFVFNLLELNNKKQKDIEVIFPLTKEGSAKSSLETFHDQKQTLNKYFIGALLTSDQLLGALRRELKKASSGIKIDDEEIKDVLLKEVIKRDVIDSDEIKEARKKVNRMNRTKQKKKSKEIIITTGSIRRENNE